MKFIDQLPLEIQEKIESSIDKISITSSMRANYWEGLSQRFEEESVKLEAVKKAALKEEPRETTKQYNLFGSKLRCFQVTQEAGEEAMMSSNFRIFAKYLVAFIVAENCVIAKNHKLLGKGANIRQDEKVDLYGIRELFLTLLTDKEICNPIVTILDQGVIHYNVILSAMQTNYNYTQLLEGLEEAIDLMIDFLLTPEQKELRISNHLEESEEPEDGGDDVVCGLDRVENCYALQ